MCVKMLKELRLLGPSLIKPSVKGLGIVQRNVPYSKAAVMRVGEGSLFSFNVERSQVYNVLSVYATPVQS